MCQLLGMNCNVPTDICFSFEGFSQRGGGTDEHRDGWGIAFFEGKGCRSFVDILPAAHSPVAHLVREYPIKSLNVIAHIRKATVGQVCLENTHPFVRELWGRYWIFAHNGDLKNFAPPLLADFRPVGGTDSEKAFCLLLQQLKDRYPTAMPSLPALYQTLRTTAAEIATYGSFNFLLSNGEHLFAHASTQLSYIVRRHPFGHAHLVDKDMTVDFREVTTERDQVAVIATTPLTDNETWTPIPSGTLAAFQDGLPLILDSGE
ncbi:glutamine amidotransferase class-II [Nitrosococcus halophilus Nc 4]|uniref:Glutamine amidotransferase class-II n=1 Tax=Nitrosococcus halophilus (strain Nc4) TaxID=472759 RepID=D5C0X5_NITHN|nr:class II glutamine amidotransferase [Nitrosococcus halophilus]ADE14532.1 glutamine amidotransferase class-II [Nitrosococcus halophilus Nc 4]